MTVFRRRFLATVGAVTGVGGVCGCVGHPSADGAHGPLSVTFERLQPGVGIARTDDIVVVGGDGIQYLYLIAEATGGDPPSRANLAFRFDGAGYQAADPTGRWGDPLYRTTVDEGPPPYDADRGRGWLCFELPDSGDPVDAALVGPNDEWVPEGLPRSRLASPSPPLSLSWSVPDSVTDGDEDPDANASTDPTVPMEFSVTNGGEHDGRFVAGLNRTGFVNTAIGLINRRIPAGEAVSWTRHEAVTHVDLGGDDPVAEYDLEWTGARLRRRVRLVSSSGTATQTPSN